jgi:hypothetical protein
MHKVQELSNRESYMPLSEPFRVKLIAVAESSYPHFTESKNLLLRFQELTRPYAEPAETNTHRPRHSSGG